MRRFSLTTKNWIPIVLITLLMLAAATSWSIAKSNRTTNSSNRQTQQTSLAGETVPNSIWSKATLSVGNLSCGGCIDNIKTSLAPLPGIGKISVDVTAGGAEVFFNPDQLDNPQLIAKAITVAGYPAKIERLDSATQVSKEQTQYAQKAKTHIASVGQLEISRQDYDTELAHARSRYQAVYGENIFSQERGAQVLERIQAQIISRLISDGVKLQEVQRAGYQTSTQRVRKEMDSYLQDRRLSMDQLKTNLSESGYDFDYFQKKFAQRVRVQSYLEEMILKESMGTDDRNQRYADWLTNAKALAKVVIYDNALRDLVKAGASSGCGGTSCSIASK